MRNAKRKSQNTTGRPLSSVIKVKRHFHSSLSGVAAGPRYEYYRPSQAHFHSHGTPLKLSPPILFSFRFNEYRDTCPTPFSWQLSRFGGNFLFMRMKDALRAVCLGLFLSLSACDPKLETGYEPRPLNSTPDDRRAYYAPAFTPESRASKENSAAPDFGIGK
jgi:hypothetical protein